MQRQAAERRHHVADPGLAARVHRRGEALHEGVHLEVEHAGELDVGRDVAERNDRGGAISASGDLRDVDPDHAIARDDAGKPRLVPAFGAGGTHRQHHVAHVGGGVVDPDSHILREWRD